MHAMCKTKVGFIKVFIYITVQRGRGMPFTGNHSSYDMRSGENSESSSGPLLMMFRLCCFFCFLPCIANSMLVAY